MTQRLSSRAPQTLANLYELLVGSPERGMVDVSYGMPSAPEQEQVCITGNLLDMAHEFASQGALSRDEAFHAELLIYVGRPGDSQQESLERAFEILAWIDVLVLRPNVTLARAAGEQGPCLYARISPERTEAGPTDAGYETEIRCIVECVCRI